MTQKTKEFIEKLKSLPDAVQGRFIEHWMKDLEGGDGATKEPPRFKDIEHLLGVYDDLPPDLSSNPAYMEGFGEKPKLRYEDIKHLAGIFEGPGDLSTNPKYLDDLGQR